MEPSKEVLANYFKHNRKYFDELANYYKQFYPEYYYQHIEPFYRNTIAPPRDRRSGRLAIILLAVMMHLVSLGVVLFLLFNQIKNINREHKYFKRDSVYTKVEEENSDSKTGPIIISDTLSAVKGLGNYEKGLTYFHQRDYTNAEKYFKKVTVNDYWYEDAKTKLEEIKTLTGKGN
jgi:uncharacterized protein YxeA